MQDHENIGFTLPPSLLRCPTWETAQEAAEVSVDSKITSTVDGPLPTVAATADTPLIRDLERICLLRGLWESLLP